MPRVVLSGLLQDIRGSMGGSTFSAWKGLNYLRNKAVTVGNPQTPAQMGIRAQFGESAVMWTGLTDAQRALWEEYAQSLKVAPGKNPVVGDFGLIPNPSGAQSGFNAYIGANQILEGAGQPRVTVPPIYGSPYATVLTVAWVSPNITVDFIATPKVDAGAPAKFLEIWLKGWWKGSHAYITTTVALPEPPVVPPTINISTIRVGSGDMIHEEPIVNLVPTEILLQGIVVRRDCKRSVPSALYRVRCV